MRRATAFIPTATLAARLQRADDAGAAVAAALAIFGAVALAFCLVSAAAAQDGVRTEKVRFAPGDDHATLRDGIVGRESISYRVGAEAGQVMTVTLEPSNHSTYFNVYLPGSGPGEVSFTIQGPGKLNLADSYWVARYQSDVCAAPAEGGALSTWAGSPNNDPVITTAQLAEGWMKRVIRALSPFDPVIRNRLRLERVFGFDYRIEVFVPAAKRRYGYYVFPLLEGERLIGRIDMKHDKAIDALKVSSLWLEPKVRLTPARQGRLEAELDRQRRFIGAAHLRFNDGYVKSDKS